MNARSFILSFALILSVVTSVASSQSSGSTIEDKLSAIIGKKLQDMGLTEDPEAAKAAASYGLKTFNPGATDEEILGAANHLANLATQAKQDGQDPLALARKCQCAKCKALLVHAERQIAILVCDARTGQPSENATVKAIAGGEYIGESKTDQFGWTAVDSSIVRRTLALTISLEDGGGSVWTKLPEEPGRLRTEVLCILGQAKPEVYFDLASFNNAIANYHGTTCQTCGGTGLLTCSTCKGIGYQRFLGIDRECRDCQWGKKTCSDCLGTGDTKKAKAKREEAARKEAEKSREEAARVAKQVEAGYLGRVADISTRWGIIEIQVADTAKLDVGQTVSIRHSGREVASGKILRIEFGLASIESDQTDSLSTLPDELEVWQR